MLKRWDLDTHDAILWLRANKNKFQMEVFEPPFMCMTIKDRKFTNAIEACFSGPQIKVGFFYFICDLDSLMCLFSDVCRSVCGGSIYFEQCH